MERMNLGKLSSAVDAAAGHSPVYETVVNFTRELGTTVTLARWERADCCDSMVESGGIGWVLSGTVRKSVILESGQRRIVDLMMRGDFFSLQGDDPRAFSFEVSTDEAVTARIAHRDLISMPILQPELYRFVHERTCETISRLENHILVQGRTRSAQKIASYLSLLCARLSEEQGAAVELPMSRYDIADHVGLAVETVSRAITDLRRRGLIELETPRSMAICQAQKLLADLT
ncbi:Crp/Fnr family transcriptional regulator [Rhizobium vallis]|nr:Crp/Fnr family transcriptional regulator [Rhizobium vallis]